MIHLCSILRVAIIGLYYFITLQFAYSLGLQRTRLGHRDINSYLLLNTDRYATRMRMRKEVVELGQIFYL